MTTLCPNVSLIFCPTMRATTSATPPGAKGTIIRNGRLGNGSACAQTWKSVHAQSANAAQRGLKSIRLLFDVGMKTVCHESEGGLHGHGRHE
jgi:hypothetical protein